MAPSTRTRAQILADDEAQLAADQTQTANANAAPSPFAQQDLAAPDAQSVAGASAEARKQQIANTAARQKALDAADVVANEVAAAKDKADTAHAEHVALQAKHALALAAANAAGSKPLVTPDGMIITAAGLPNSCSICGKTIAGDLWYAQSEDAARAGVGYCADDAQKQSDKLKAQKGAVAPVGPRTFGEKSVANQTELQAKEDAARQA